MTFLANLSMRAAFGLGAVLVAALLGYGYFLQYVQGLVPCPLCLVQRGFYYGLLAVFVAGAAHGPRGFGGTVYGVAALVFALGGFATAARQVWLQHLPPDQVPQCGPDLAFMLENFPLARTLENLFKGAGECAKVDWTFLGFSIAEWSLAWFAAFALFALWLALRNRGQTPIS
jgi:disulfide bond formation protein DsbB